MRTITAAAAALLAITTFAGVVSAQESGNLNPFRTGAGGATATTTEAPETSGRWLTWPQMPSLGLLKRDPTKPTMLQNMREGVRNSWKRTTTFLNPWSEAGEESVSQPIGNSSGGYSTYGTPHTETTQRRFGLLPNLFGSSEPEPETSGDPQGVVDFLNQPRVNYP